MEVSIVSDLVIKGVIPMSWEKAFVGLARRPTSDEGLSLVEQIKVMGLQATSSLL